MDNSLLNTLQRIDQNLARLLAIFEYLHRDICDELDRKDADPK